MSDSIDRQKVIDICNRAIDLLNGELGTGAMTAVRDWVVNLPSVHPDLDITAKIDKAYNDGYEAGYLQGRHDWGDLDG